MRALLAILVLPTLVACGDGGGPSPLDASTTDAGVPDAAPPDAGDAGTTDAGAGDAGTGLDEDGCRILTLGERGFQFNLFGQLTGLRYGVSPNLEGVDGDHLLVELYDSTTGGLPALTTGTFDLASGVNDNLGTCQHCVWLKVDESPDGVVETIYYQTQGTLTLTRVSDPFEPAFAGSSSRIVLRRASVTDEGRSVLVPDGDCVSVTLTFDTTPTPDASCTSAEECGNPLLEVCDPATNRCAEPQCGEFFSCPEPDDVCVTQYRDQFFGACYDWCDPTVNASQCEDGQRCVQFGVDPSFGLCKWVGELAAGEACEPSDNGTSCGGDAVCSAASGTCTPSCEYFADATGCPTGTVCSFFGVCEPTSAGSPATLGEPCDPSVELATGCGADGQSFRGICFAYPPAAPVCERACLGADGCGAGEFCALRFSSGLGICLPVPVCGDGVLGEIDELCDDGNTASGDGCSADCRTVEYGVICTSLPGLSLGVDVAGDTATARDGFKSSCQLGVARAELFAVTPPGPGRLTLRLVSPTNHTLALRGACADDTTELSCAEQAFEGEAEELVHQVTSTSAPGLTAIVSAFTVLDEGPFTLRAEFVAEQCGDGIIAGNEVCDDGNTSGSDGCSANCRAIEYDYYCATAPELSTTAPNVGDTTGGPELFVNQCSADNGIASGPDRLYRWTAPANGELHLRLDSIDNLVIAVLDGCGAPAAVSELACNTVFTLGDVDVRVTAGQVLTILVDGFLPDNQAAYSLEATFTPD
ncbi:DUF4215 domain-containing protein [Myxococcota bacterium]|nr:DUF4215 domain-containing protein [Myxococcota bacterium]